VQQVDQFNEDRRLPALPLRWNTPQIAEACNRFYRPQLAAEIAQMQERGFLNTDWAMLIERLLKGSLGQRLDKNQAFLLRVGRHSGAESVTLNGVRSIKILLGKDSATGKMRSENRAKGTSWWLAADDIQARAGMLPFGWLLVEWQLVQQVPADGADIQKALAGLSTEYTNWIARERQQAEIAARQQAAVQAQQAAIVAKATFSPEQKAIDELRGWFEVDRKTKQLKPMGRVVGTLNRLLKEGLTWPMADRQALAELAEKIFDQKSVGGDDRLMQERKAKIQQLREGTT
jgi:CRISPR-associated protein Csm5